MQNEILKPVLSTDETPVPRYDIVNPNGNVVQHNVEIRLNNEVEREGTPYDADSVLPATLCRKLGLPDSATPADAFAEVIALTQGKVGDTKRTFRTDLGDNWALCNGDYFDPNEYPELAQVTPDVVALRDAGLVTSREVPTLGSSTYDYQEINGYRIITYTYDGMPHLLYSTDNFVTYTDIAMSTLSSNSAGSIIIRFVNGYWICAWATNSSPYGSIQVRVRAGSLEGEWGTQATIPSAGYRTVHDIWYDGTTYYMAVSGSGTTGSDKWSSAYPYIIASPTPDFTGSATTKVATTSSNYLGFVRTEEQYVFAGCSSTSTVYFAHASLTAPTIATLTTLTVSGGGSEVSKTFTYLNGYYILKLKRTGGVTAIIYSDDVLATTWQTLELPYYTSIGSVYYGRGYYFTSIELTSASSATPYLAMGSSLDSPDSWTYAKVTFETDDCVQPVITPSYIEVLNGKQAYAIPLYCLPISDPAPLYDYIKVK